MPSLHTHLDNRSRTGRGAHPSLWMGVIVNITATAVWVRVPQLAQDDIAATNTIAGALSPGDRVVVGLMEGRVDNLVVLAKESPTVPAHIHPEQDITYPAWATATLTADWAAGAEAGAFPGLRYRTDSRHVHLHGHVTGGPGIIATLPITPAYTTRLLSDGAVLTLATNGELSTTTTGTVHINGSAPLT